MSLVPLNRILHRALEGGYGVGYFEAWDSYSLEAVLEAAEAERAPVILGFGCMMADRAWLDAGGIELLAGVGRLVAARAQVPAALLLNEAHNRRQAERGVLAGFNAVMVDTSAWPRDRAVQEVRQLVEFAHAHGAAVEAELGRLPDALLEGGIDDSRASLTDPDDAADFVRQTGVDCLAVSFGNIHILTQGEAPVDVERLAAVYRRVQIPLVIHGGTSFPAGKVSQAVASGGVKFNVGTALKLAFLDGVRQAAAGWGERVDVHAVLGSHRQGDFLEAGKAGMRARVRELIRLYGAAGRADDAGW